MLLELLIVLPLLMLLVFGLIEFTLAFRSASTLADASRAAARTAASVGGTDAFEEDVAAAASAAVSALPNGAAPVFMVVYAANEHGLPGSMTRWSLDALATCTPECVRYEWSSDARAFVVADWTWDPATHDVCGPDYGRVGAVVFADFSTLTPVFAPILGRSVGDGDPLMDHAVFAFEPKVDGGFCSG